MSLRIVALVTCRTLPRRRSRSTKSSLCKTNLRPISHPELKSANWRGVRLTTTSSVVHVAPQCCCVPSTHTRVDAMVFISALQRCNSKPHMIYMKRLNELLPWLQSCPKIVAHRLQQSRGGRRAEAVSRETPTPCRVVSDAACRREG